MRKIVYLSLGSNLGDRARLLDSAILLLQDANLIVLRRSSLYETEPRDFTSQPWFLNMVVEAETSLFPRQLLAQVRKVENRLGRKRSVDKGPRTIDIDIVLYGNSILRTADLTIPHPRMCERRFVLEPLAELNPDLRHPGSHRKVSDLLVVVASQKVTKLVQS